MKGSARFATLHGKMGEDIWLNEMESLVIKMRCIQILKYTNHTKRFWYRFFDLLMPQLFKHTVHHVHEGAFLEVVLGLRLRRRDDHLTWTYVRLYTTL